MRPLLLDVERRRTEIGRLGDAHAVQRTDGCAGEYVDPLPGFFKITEQLDQSTRLESAPGAPPGEDNCNFSHDAASVSEWIGKDEVKIYKIGEIDSTRRLVSFRPNT
jgi:hypothetical protein